MKLDTEYTKAMEEAEDREFDNDGEFEPLPDGFYRAKIESITLSKKAGPSGYKQWVVVWRIVGGKWRNRTIWDRISLSPKAAFKMRQLYDALDYTYDSDSDELVNEQAILELIQEPIQSGDRAGEMSNSVERVHSKDDESAASMVATK